MLLAGAGRAGQWATDERNAAARPPSPAPAWTCPSPASHAGVPSGSISAATASRPAGSSAGRPSAETNPRRVAARAPELHQPLLHVIAEAPQQRADQVCAVAPRHAMHRVSEFEPGAEAIHQRGKVGIIRLAEQRQIARNQGPRLTGAGARGDGHITAAHGDRRKLLVAGRHLQHDGMKLFLRMHSYLTRKMPGDSANRNRSLDSSQDSHPPEAGG